MYHIHAGRTRPKLPAEVDWWDRTRAEYITHNHNQRCNHTPILWQGREQLPGLVTYMPTSASKAVSLGVTSTVSLASMRLLVPPLTPMSYKGQAGKIGVLGGCAEYTGAPFYAALSALKLGADLSHVFCDELAAVPIKSYSPELIVHGCLRASSAANAADPVSQADEVSKWFPALSALVVGPGLGRDETHQAVAALVVQRAVAASLPMVIDADGMRIVLEQPELVAGSKWTVLTPNKPEYQRLLDAFASKLGTVADGGGGDTAQADEIRALAQALNGPAVVRKGPTDWISDGETVIANSEEGSLKRSGGQGDVLAGSIATLLAWAHAAAGKQRLPAGGPPPPLLAAYTGCMLTRRFSRAAFAKHRRSMTAPDLIAEIGETFEEFCPADAEATELPVTERSLVL